MTGITASYCIIAGHCENTMVWITQSGVDHFDPAYSFIEGHCGNRVNYIRVDSASLALILQA